MKRRLYCLVSTFVVLAPSLALGQAASVQSADGGKRSDEDKAPTVKLVLHPAAEPRPALKYHLFPPLVDRRPGNAAVLYGKVTAEQRAFFGNRELWEKIVKWMDMPLEELRKSEAPGWLHGGTHFKFLDRAARCEHVDWQLPLREEVFYAILLPELQQTREFGRMLAVKARLHIAEGEFAEAVHTLQTGYALGRHVGQGQTLVNGLVGIAIARMMSKQVESLAQQPGAPNLYWALTHLPDPLIDMRPGFEAEWAMLYLSYPELRNLADRDYSPEQWREQLNTLTGSITFLSGGALSSRPELLTTALALKGYPMAKKGLIEQGYDPNKVEAMPVPQVVLLYTMYTYEDLRDEMFKWFATPYWQARAGLDRANRQLAAGRRREVIPIASLLLPAVAAAHRADAQSRRTIAALRVIEAIRLYGAAPGNPASNLPEKLSDITAVPIPIDPVSGEPFLYRKTGNTAVLEASLPPGMSAEHYGLRYEITFASKGN